MESGPLCDRDAAIEDVTRRFGDEVGSMAESLIRWCGNGKPVPGTTRHCDHPIEAEATIHAVAGHMHLLGRSIKIEVNRGTAGAATVLDIPEYNFDDQGIRPLATPVKLKKGDVLRVTCTHDAGLRKLLPPAAAASAALCRVGRRDKRRNVSRAAHRYPIAVIEVFGCFPGRLTDRRECTLHEDLALATYPTSVGVTGLDLPSEGGRVGRRGNDAGRAVSARGTHRQRRHG
jgi:hypothetical protein